MKRSGYMSIYFQKKLTDSATPQNLSEIGQLEDFKNGVYKFGF